MGGGILTSCMAVVACQPRTRTMPGRSTSRFHRPGKHRWHQARPAVRCWYYVTSSVVQVHTPVVLPVRRLLPYTRYHAPEAQRARAKFDRKLRHVFSRCIRNKFDRRNGGQGSAVILNPAQLLIIVAKSSMWPMVATKQEI